MMRKLIWAVLVCGIVSFCAADADARCRSGGRGKGPIRSLIAKILHR